MKRLAFVAVGGLALVGAAAAGLAQMRGELAYDSAAPVNGVGGDPQVSALLDRIEAASTRKERAAEELDALGKRVVDSRAAVRVHMRALYRMTRAGMLPVAGGFDALLQHAGRVRRLRKLVEAEGNRLVADKERRVALRSEIATLGRTIEESRAKLSEVQQRRGAAPAGMDAALFSSLAAAPAASGPGSDAFYGIRFSDSAPIQRFETLRGSLAFPVSGDVIVRDASRAESDGPGLEMVAPAGTPVRAVAGGRVAFNDDYGSYGRLVILDHSDGYYSVYGGLGIVEVRVGDDVSRSARIGAVGGNRETSALFFEMRKGTRTISPRPWLGI